MILVISEPTSGKSFQTEVAKDKESLLIGRKVGDTVDGGGFGAAGYTLSITGGSDQSGVPIRPDVSGPRRMQVLLSDGPGFRSQQAGERRVRYVRGQLISDEIQQVNARVTTAGTKPLAELFPPSKKEEKKK